MKLSVELGLIVVLVVLMYYRPYFLRMITAHPLGRLVMVALLVVVTHMYGKYAGILMALILLLLFHNLFEGMENMEDEKGDEESKETAEEDEEEGTEEMLREEEEEAEEKHQMAKTTADLISNDPGDLRNKDKMTENPDAAGAVTKEDEPVGMGGDAKKPIQEGFSLYY